MGNLLKSQVAVFLSGTIFAYYTVYQDFRRFYFYEGTIFKLKNCTIPNPVTTACFYGSFAFLMGLIISLIILKNFRVKKSIIKLQKYLLFLTEFAFVFAWTNFSLIFYKYLKTSSGTFIGCSGVKALSPFLTPCFYGSVIFTISLFLVFYIKKRLTKV